MKRKTLVKLFNFSMARWIKTGEEKYQIAYNSLLDELDRGETDGTQAVCKPS